LLQAGEGSTEIQELVRNRYRELFGAIAASEASIKFVKRQQRLLVLRCSLSSIPDLLVTIPTVDPPLLLVGVSGTLRGLFKQGMHFR
jgi:RNase P/RNase MRP subunit POP5